MFWMTLPNNYQCPTICKNGFSTLGAISYKYHTGKQLNIYDNIWNNIYRYFYVNYTNGLKSFIVYRDPYLRVKSLYTDICTNINCHSKFLDNIKHNRNEIINRPISLYEYLIKKQDNDIDEHIQKQSLLFQKANIDKIDYIVKIEDLPIFIKQELNEEPIIMNKSNGNIDTHKLDIYKPLFEEYYKDDYILLEKYKDKIYKPCYIS